jgi:hypothetical protein
MTTRIVKGLELFSEAQLESLEFLPEELENIEFELYPNLESISPEQVAKDLEGYFEAEGLEWRVTGRIGALVATRNYPAGTVGAVVHRAVSPFARIFGDLASGNIGRHYREADTVRLLMQQASDANLLRFARNETQWWKRQKGFAGWVGKRLSETARANVLMCVRNNPTNPGSCRIK